MKRWMRGAALAIAWAAAWAAVQPAAAQDLSLKGTVLEAKDAGAYTYLRLKTANGETWAAVNKSAVKKGEEVTIVNGMEMNKFESKALGRSFDRIIFGSLAGGAGEDLGQVHKGVAKAADVGDVKVPKAQGSDARTVAEIVGKRAELKDKTVVVRGKVVKFTPGVMGKNWIHLRDGTGTEKDGTHDVLVTSKESTQIGAVVVAKGTVRTDVDLGSGYAYKVLVEGATLAK